MFPCKVKIDQLDRTNKKVKDIDIKANKALTRGKIKKVQSKEGERTPFYYLGGYFENNGKAIGDFLSLGNSLKLEKHFVQNEMKKSKNSFMDEKLQDPKKAAMGEVYVEKEVLYFEPHDKCKIPESKWPKILKDMKEYFSGMKAVAVVNGKMLEAEEDKGSSPVKDTSENIEPVEEIEDKVSAKELAEDYKELLTEFKEVQKSEHDVDVAKLLYKEIVVWRKNFGKLDATAQEKLAKFNQSCETTLSELKKIIKVDQNIGEEVKKVVKIVLDYIEIDNETSPNAVKLKKEAKEILDKLQKFCKFVNAKKLTQKCNQLQTMLES